MKPQDAKTFNTILKSSYAMFGKGFDANMFKIWWTILEPYELSGVELAFTKHIATSHFMPKPADILECLPDLLGHPEPEEAWNRAPKSNSEAGYTTDEITRALGAADSSLIEGNQIAARMAFLESYKKILAEAKAQQRRAKFWYQGATQCTHEQRLQIKEQKVIEAAELGWLTPTRALNALEIICSEQDKELGPLRDRLLMLPGGETLLIGSGLSKTESQSKRISAGLSLIKTEFPSEGAA